MIDTYRTSVFPPPVPLRLSQDEAGRCRFGTRVLAAIVVLHLLLSVGGFLFLYTGRMTSQPPVALQHEGKASTAQRRAPQRAAQTHTTTMASMTIKSPKPKAREPLPLGYLQWNINHSIMKNVDHYHASWLRVREPGDYYVYARVSFSGGSGGRGGRGGRGVGGRGGGGCAGAAPPGQPLVSVVRLKDDDGEETGKPRNVMKAYCSGGDRLNGNPCTASQGQLLQLQAGNLLAVWVENSTWVDYEREATTFGLYKL